MLENLGHFVDGHLAVQVPANRDHRRKSAVADAACGLESKVKIFRRAPALDAELPFELLEHFAGALHLAGVAQADANGVPASGCQAEGAVKGGQAVGAAEGHSHGAGDMPECILRQVTELVLHVLKNGDEFAPLRVVLLNDLVDGFHLHKHLLLLTCHSEESRLDRDDE